MKISKKIGTIGLVVIFCLLIVTMLLKFPFWRPPKPSNRVFDKFELASSEFKVRATAFEVDGTISPGAYYVFEASSNTTDDWETVITFRNDDHIPINKNGIAFLNEAIGYIYKGWMYAVTLDSGKSWSVWDAKKDLPNWKCCNYELIRAVEMNPEGEGKLTLNVISIDRGEVPFLYTRDFGRTWSDQP